MFFYLGAPISEDRFFAAARKIFGPDLTKIRLCPFEDAPMSREDMKKALGMTQFSEKKYMATKVALTEDESIDPIEAARALAVEGGVDVLWYDIREDSDEGEWDWAGYAIAPYILFKPDGSEHKARLDEERRDVDDDRWLGDKLIVLD